MPKAGSAERSVVVFASTGPLCKSPAPVVIIVSRFQRPGSSLKRKFRRALCPAPPQKFLEANSLRLVIRSHEGPDARFQRDDGMGCMKQGYSVDHDTPRKGPRESRPQ